MKKLYVLALVGLMSLGAFVSFAGTHEENRDSVILEFSDRRDDRDRRHDPRIILGCVKRQAACDRLASEHRCHRGIAKVTNRCPSPFDNGRLTCLGEFCH